MGATLAHTSVAYQQATARALTNADLAAEIPATINSSSFWALCVRYEAARRLSLLAEIGPQ
jgi:hypothetical protein